MPFVPADSRVPGARALRWWMARGVGLTLGPLRCRLRWGFFPPPYWSDLSGYRRHLLPFLERRGVHRLPGDVVEIGAFLGGGTYQLCKYFAGRAPEKKVIAVDLFEPSADGTVNVLGTRMSDMYGRLLAGRSQRELFDRVTRGCANLAVVTGDTMGMTPPAARLCFAYIDGNHDSAYVRNDFGLVWPSIVPGGWVGFDDYGEDLPMVTSAIHTLIGAHAPEIARVVVPGGAKLFLQRGPAGKA